MFDLGHRVLDHLAVAVADLEQAAKLYETLGFEVGAVEVVETQRVRLRKALKDGMCVELLEAFPAGAGSIGKYVSKKGPGLHHVALRSTDIWGDLERYAKSGVTALPGYPSQGSEGSTVAFLDPKTTGGVLIEIVQQGVKDRI